MLADTIIFSAQYLQGTLFLSPLINATITPNGPNSRPIKKADSGFPFFAPIAVAQITDTNQTTPNNDILNPYKVTVKLTVY